MHFDNIVKSYCNKVNDVARLKKEVEVLSEKLISAFKAGYVSACNEESYDKGLKKFVDNTEKSVKK